MSINAKLGWILGLGVVVRLLLSVQIYSGDVNNHVSWGKDMLRNGPGGIYERDFYPIYGTMTPTYPPLSIYMFTVSEWMYETLNKTVWWLNLNIPIFPSNFIYVWEDQDTQPAFFKVWAIAADILIGFTVYKFSKKLTKDTRWWLFSAAMVIVNPAFFYNSAYWGQLEAVPIAFLLLAFYFLFYSPRHILSALFLSLALLSKQTSIIFVPLFSLAYFLKFGWSKSLKGLAVSAITAWILFLPFYHRGNLLTFPFTTYLAKIKTGSGSDFVNDHAFNLWRLGPESFQKTSDSGVFGLGLTYSAWGYLVFGCIYVLVLLKLAKRKVDTTLYFRAAVIVMLGGFLVLTRMHERYLAPAIAFMIVGFVGRRAWIWGFIFLSLFHFLNLYHNWWAPRWPILVDWLSVKGNVDLLILMTSGLFLALFYDFLKQDNFEKLKTTTQ